MSDTQILNSSNQVESKVFFTTKEVMDMKIPYHNEPPKPEQCKFCGKTLFYQGIMFGGEIVIWRTNEPERCDCDKAAKFWMIRDKQIREKERQKKIADEERKNMEKIQSLINLSGIKKRFLSRTFDNFKINSNNQKAFNLSKKYADNFDVYAEQGIGLFFEGTCGTGKTHLAVAIALQLIQIGIPVICKTSIDLLSDLKKTYDNNNTYTEDLVLKRYKRAKLLVVDDLGKEQCTEWSMQMLYSIFNDRYEAMRPTIITTNYNEDMLVQRMTPSGMDSTNIQAIISRLRECTDVVTMAYEDWRSTSNGCL